MIRRVFEVKRLRVGVKSTAKGGIGGYILLIVEFNGTGTEDTVGYLPQEIESVAVVDGNRACQIRERGSKNGA